MAEREKRYAWTIAKSVVAWLSISPHFFAHGGTILFLTAFANTFD